MNPARWLVCGMLAALVGCAADEPAPPPVTAPAVVVDAARAAADRVLVVTVVNDGVVRYTDDQKTDCSIVLLQRKQDNGWVSLSNCGSERAPQVVAVAAGERREIRLDLAGTNFAEMPASPGTYRVHFGHRLTAEPSGTQTHALDSAEFRLG